MSEISECRRIQFTDWNYETFSEHSSGFFGKKNFGIRAVGYAPNGWRLIEIVPNVSTKHYIAAKIAGFFNEHKLPPAMLRCPSAVVCEIMRCSDGSDILEN